MSSTAVAINKSYLSSDLRKQIYLWSSVQERHMHNLDAYARQMVAKERYMAYLHLLAVDSTKDYNILAFSELVRGFPALPDMIERIDVYFYHVTKRSPFTLLWDVCNKLAPLDVKGAPLLPTDSVVFTSPFDICAATEKLLNVKCNDDKIPDRFKHKMHGSIHRYPCICPAHADVQYDDEEARFLRANPTFIPAHISFNDHKYCLSESWLRNWCDEEAQLHDLYASSATRHDAWKIFQGTAFAQYIIPGALPAAPPVAPPAASSSSLSIRPRARLPPIGGPKPLPDQAAFCSPEKLVTPERPERPLVAPGAPLRQRRPDTPIPSSPVYEPSTSPVYHPITPSYDPTEVFDACASSSTKHFLIRCRRSMSARTTRNRPMQMLNRRRIVPRLPSCLLPARKRNAT